MRIYLGAAIDASKTNPTKSFEKLSEICTALFPKCVIYNPFAAYINANNIDIRNYESISFIESINYYAMAQADLAIFLVEDSPSFGVPLEIAHRDKQQKPCLVIYNSVKKPGVYLMANVVRNKFGVLLEMNPYEMNAENSKKLKAAINAMGLKIG